MLSRYRLTFTVCPVCLLSPSPLPKSPEAFETERCYTKIFTLFDLNIKRTIYKYSRRQSHPRRHTNARQPESSPPLSAVQCHPKNTQTHINSVYSSVRVVASSEISKRNDSAASSKHLKSSIQAL